MMSAIAYSALVFAAIAAGFMAGFFSGWVIGVSSGPDFDDPSDSAGA
jgi:hypothetical protein